MLFYDKWYYTNGFFERYTLGEYFIKRGKKTVIPFVAWNLIALGYDILVGKISPDEMNLKYIYQGMIGIKIMSQDNVMARIIKFIGKYTFAIYLMQFLLLTMFSSLSCVDTKSIIYRLGAPFIMIPIIICITYFMRKIPILKHIVP